MTPTPSRPKTHRYALIIYLLLANGITWLCWLPGLVIGAQQGYVMPNVNTYRSLFETGFANSEHMLLGIAFALGVYGPLIGGLLATWMDGGKQGLVDLWRRITHWRVDGRWYFRALIITLLLSAIPVGIFGLAGGFAPSRLPILYILLVFGVQLFTSGLGEEPGWRGFLLPRLQARFEGDKYIWVLGLIWAIWHYPLVIIQTLSPTQNVPVAQLIITLLMGLAGQTMSLIGLTYIYAWFYNQTQSIFLAMVFHALSNVLTTWLLSFLSKPQSATLFVALMPWIVVVFLQKRLSNDHFPGVPPA